MRKRNLLAVPVAALILLGCDSYNDKRGRGDAPVGKYDDSPAQIINFPDKFHNVAFKCFGGNGIYTHTRPAPPIVIVNDPECDG